MKKTDIKTGDVFLAFNKNMTPPKMKYHLAINTNLNFLINTKPSFYSCMLTPEDCSILSHECYVDCSNIRLEAVKTFNIIKKEELSVHALIRLIEKVKCAPTLTPVQIECVVKELEICIKNKM